MSILTRGLHPHRTTNRLSLSLAPSLSVPSWSPLPPWNDIDHRKGTNHPTLLPPLTVKPQISHRFNSYYASTKNYQSPLVYGHSQYSFRWKSSLSPFVSINVPRRSLFISSEPTPNPDSLKFTIEDKTLELPSSYDFPNMRSALHSPLAKMLFNQEGVKRVFLANEFVTVTKDEMMEWEFLRPIIIGTIVEFFSSGQPIISTDASSQHSDTLILDTDSEEVAMIKELIEAKIRPAIQGDGGDVTFMGLVDGVVFVKLSGSCSGCPSSSVTLKSGIERMLMHWIPQVTGVIEVQSEEEFKRITGQDKSNEESTDSTSDSTAGSSSSSSSSSQRTLEEVNNEQLFNVEKKIHQD